MNDKLYMNRAINIARRAIGHTSPNPMVGAVIVNQSGQIIGEGYHQCYGMAHAEVNAIAQSDNIETLQDATLYVTLEPCSHHGKTPPCTDLIIARGIPRVVVGCVDPFEKVSGRGIEKLRAAGVDVKVGVCQSECRELNKRFITSQTLHRPYIILKWAQSSDHYIDIVRDQTIKPAWFTGEVARNLVHRWRAEEDSIMVGRRTAQLDNPHLTVRNVEGRNPIRIVLDQNNLLNNELHLFNGEAPTIIFSALDHHVKNAKTIVLDYTKPIIEQILGALHLQGIQSVIVEGGAMLINSFINNDLWDEARIFTSPDNIAHYYPTIHSIEGVAAPKLPKKECYQHRSEQIGDAQLEILSRTQW